MRRLVTILGKLVRGVAERRTGILNEEVVEFIPLLLLYRNRVIKRIGHQNLPQLGQFLFCSEMILVVVASKVAGLTDVSSCGSSADQLLQTE